MNNKIKKTLWGFGASITTIAPIAISISCGNTKNLYDDNNFGEIWHGSHRDIVVYQETDAGENPYYGRPNEALAKIAYLPSAIISQADNSTQFGLFSLVKQDIDRSTEVTTTNADGIQETKISVKPNRKTLLAFEAVKSVVLKYKDSSNLDDKEFDSDSFDINDDKSINSNAFKDAIAASDANGISYLKDIEFKFRDDLQDHHWIQQITGKKGAPIKPEDFWTSIQFQIMRNNAYRSKYGGSKQINDYVNSKLKKDIFLEPQLGDEFGWLGYETLYGLKNSQFEPTKQAKENFIKGNGIHFAFNGEQKGKSITSFWKDIESTSGLKALPTKSFEELKKNYPVTENVFKGTKDPKKALAAYQKSALADSGIVEAYSAQKDSDHYVAGKYYLSKSDKKKLVYKQNQDYINSHWLNLKNKAGKKVTLNSYTIEFITATDVVSSTIQTAFEQGFSAQGRQEGISENDYNKALDDPQKYGVKFFTGYQANKLIGDFSNIQFLPNLPNPYVLNADQTAAIPGTKNGFVFFNDNYAKVLWGDTIANLHKAQDKDDDKDIHGEWANQAFAGTGIQFITNLLAAQNWFTFVKNQDSSLQDSTTVLPPEGPINGKDGNDFLISQSPINPSSNTEILHDRLRSRIGLDFYDDDSKDKLDAPISTETKRSEYKDVYTSANLSSLERYGAPSAQLAKYKANITEALDKAGIGINEKVTWELPIARGITSVNLNVIYKQLQDFIKSLDPRLNPVAQMNPYKEDGTKPQNEVAQADYDQDFTLSDNSAGSYLWLLRIHLNNVGYNASSLNISFGSTYEVNSLPGGIYTYTIDLFSGFLLALSYYADHDDLLKGNDLKGLKIFIDSFEESKNTSFVKGGLWENKFTSTHKKVFIEALQNFEFKKLWDNPSSVIASYKYAGLNSFGKIRKLLTTIHGLKDNDLKNDLNVFNSLFIQFTINAQNILDEKIKNGLISNDDLLKAVIAYNIIQPGGLNPALQAIENRENPGIYIEKTWFTTGGINTSNYSDISWSRVDSDKGIYLK